MEPATQDVLSKRNEARGDVKSILKISHLTENSSVEKSFPTHSVIRDAEIRLDTNMGRYCQEIRS